MRRGCGGAAATERRSAVGTLDRMIRPSQRGIFRRPPYLARQSARLPYRGAAGKRKRERWRKRERERERGRRERGSTVKSSTNPEKGKEDIGEKSAHRPGILSCHSSTPLKSYWCDGTLSSSWWSTSDRVVVIIVKIHRDIQDVESVSSVKSRIGVARFR